MYSSKRFRGPLRVTPQKLAYISLDQDVILAIDKYELKQLSWDRQPQSNYS